MLFQLFFSWMFASCETKSHFEKISIFSPVVSLQCVEVFLWKVTIVLNRLLLLGILLPLIEGVEVLIELSCRPSHVWSCARFCHVAMSLVYIMLIFSNENYTIVCSNDVHNAHMIVMLYTTKLLLPCCIQ